MKTHIVTTFSKHHIIRALAFRESVRIHTPDIHVWLLCLDMEGRDMLKKLQAQGHLDKTTIFTPEELAAELSDTEILAARNNRTVPEFASTIKPTLMLYMLKTGKVAHDELLAFIDPDMFFYQPTYELFEKIYASGSITITPHRFPKHREDEIYKKGIYNAGMVYMRNDATALACLEKWRKQCIEWCFLRYENGQIGDQGYLSEWPKLYKNVFLLTDKGVNLSTWNIERYRIHTLSKQPPQFKVDEAPLIIYHFHGLKLYLTGSQGSKERKVRAYPITVYHRGIYRPCIHALHEAYRKVAAIDPSWDWGFVTRPDVLRLLKQNILQLARSFRFTFFSSKI